MKLPSFRRSPHSRPPVSAAKGSRTLAAQLFGGKPEHRLALVRAAWRSSVGPELARRTEVLAIEGRTLRVRVPDARWQKVLHRMRHDILRRLSETAGALAPSAIGFLLGEVAGADAPPVRAADAAPVRDVAVPEAIRVAANVIHDPEMRDRFTQTAARYLSRQVAAPRS